MSLSSLLKTTLPFLLLSLPTQIHARTDLAGCISSATTNQWHEASMIWYVPSSGEICDFPDCGGGRAPPKYDNPACPLYTGTATYEPSYLEGYGPGAVVSTSTVEETGSATASATATESGKEEEEVTATSTSTFTSVASSVLIPTHSPSWIVTPSASLVPTSTSTGGVASATETEYDGNGAGMGVIISLRPDWIEKCKVIQGRQLNLDKDESFRNLKHTSSM
ncbi:hypothetical protein BDW59DRAFT_159289 [Aspergillus cavernicola]|uniref:Uncharacterized protein n=1 Tax=Aspergillus cavernicola TaxID=176166 RepID=A0ABR4IMP6_9EURO